MPRAARAGRVSRDIGCLGASAACHAVVVGAMVLVAVRPLAPPLERPVALMWENSEPGARDTEDSAAMPAAPAAPTQVPPPPSAAATAPPQAPIAASPPPPAPEMAMLPPPAAPPPAPPSRPPQPATRTVWTPPARASQAAPADTGGGIATGAIVPARPASGVSNPAPDYPRGSRIRGEQGRVTLLVQVAPDGSVASLSVLGSSGHAALDAEAQKAVRRWRFEPARQDGRAVAATLPVAITFRLDGESRW